ncbi:energy transducer TonB [Hymenobacter chitinivorans]|uniref:TonB family protein n=1 Tax=Hymenobacter chitinivorans DSM 11115 TaxID=1121954 RepID=A0A2M9BRG2_9BACT|nr:energy transducer TonB [Hymenobacter chitinivorans]PJJ60533.1 TonB family protein [Hymenobacter chitinivorans DSM 11115]
MRKVLRIGIPGLLLAAGILLSLPEAASGQAPRSYPYRTVTYLAPNGAQLPGPEGAGSRIERTFRDSLSGSARHYNAAGKLERITPYAVMDVLKLGPETTYYDTGQLHTKDDYVGSKRNGEFVVYYPDSKVRRREIYVDDKRQSGECYAPDGSMVPFYEYRTMPLFKGASMSEKAGMNKVLAAVAATLQYPASALRNQTQGQVFVTLTVGPAGEVTGVSLAKSVSPDLDAAAIAAVKRLPAFTPGHVDGVNTGFAFILPINFAITGGSTQYPSPMRHRGGVYPVDRPTFRN